MLPDFFLSLHRVWNSWKVYPVDRTKDLFLNHDIFFLCSSVTKEQFYFNSIPAWFGVVLDDNNKFSWHMWKISWLRTSPSHPLLSQAYDTCIKSFGDWRRRGKKPWIFQFMLWNKTLISWLLYHGTNCTRPLASCKSCPGLAHPTPIGAAVCPRNSHKKCIYIVAQNPIPGEK